jgi:phosphate transport system ATP-binding protein
MSAVATDAPLPAGAPATGHTLDIDHLTIFYGSRCAVRDVSMHIEPRSVTALIGPSGCGKSSVLRCLNRMHEVVPGAHATGKVLLNGQDIYGPGIDPVAVRRRIGMVFQRPNVFPTMSIQDNVLAGLRLSGRHGTGAAELVETSLRAAALWDEVRDRLKAPATALSGGQQQRLCIARAIAVQPDVLLMDEPCSALDPVATLKVEELILALRQDYTIVVVTHNMQQATRISDHTAFMNLHVATLTGVLVEEGPTRDLFSNPKMKETEDYVMGRFG